MMEHAEIRLHQTATKLKAIAFLIEAQGLPQVMPADPKEINWGIALTLEDFAAELFEVAESLEPSSPEKADG